jgi:hypothetical protein
VYAITGSGARGSSRVKAAAGAIEGENSKIILSKDTLGDRVAYTRGKKEFIEKVTRRAKKLYGRR